MERNRRTLLGKQAGRKASPALALWFRCCGFPFDQFRRQ
ncbi:hypothetical protein EP10_001696 [Geobacillus icigianus]|uniref:Uncharacterized protein n=1 Tax=Geobacillus icigianus TaxID=1430331 RepID=A0ABU6BGD1_9BACL|nr:hypothetical protein [Geobacillus icigianus]